MKYIVVGHVNTTGLAHIGISGQRQPLYQVFSDEQSARDYIKKYNVELVAIYKAEEIPLEFKIVEETIVNRKSTMTWE